MERQAAVELCGFIKRRLELGVDILAAPEGKAGGEMFEVDYQKRTQKASNLIEQIHSIRSYFPDIAANNAKDLSAAETYAVDYLARHSS